MRIAQLQIDFMMHGCRSLKDKRARLGKLKDKFGKQTGLAVCESDYQDSHRQAQWTFVSCASSAVVVEQTLGEVERYVSMSLDAQVIGMRREWIQAS